MTPVYIIIGVVAFAALLVWLLIHKTSEAAKLKADNKQLRETLGLANQISKIDNTPVADDVDVAGMLRKRRK